MLHIKPKTPTKSATHERQKLRASDERRTAHACEVLEEMVKRFGESRDELFLYSLKSRLLVSIKNQHITDPSYKEYRLKKGLENFPAPGDY